MLTSEVATVEGNETGKRKDSNVSKYIAINRRPRNNTVTLVEWKIGSGTRTQSIEVEVDRPGRPGSQACGWERDRGRGLTEYRVHSAPYRRGNVDLRVGFRARSCSWLRDSGIGFSILRGFESVDTARGKGLEGVCLKRGLPGPACLPSEVAPRLS